jgi:hypothetical protein
MKRVIVVPRSDVARFPGHEVIARSRSLVALMGDSAPGRSREGFDSEEAFLDAASCGLADRHTFNTLDEAATFARSKLDELDRAAKPIEDALNLETVQRFQPQRDNTALFEIISGKKHAG